MKTFTRIIRRYILAVTTLIVLFLALFVYTGCSSPFSGPACFSAGGARSSFAPSRTDWTRWQTVRP